MAVLRSFARLMGTSLRPTFGRHAQLGTDTRPEACQVGPPPERAQGDGNRVMVGSRRAENATNFSADERTEPEADRVVEPQTLADAFACSHGPLAVTE